MALKNKSASLTGAWSRAAPHPAALSWLLASLLLVVVPHAGHLPPWLSGGFLLVCLWRLGHDRRGLKLPGKGMRFLLVVLAVASLTMSYGTITGKNAGVAMLVAMSALKLLELRSRRDVMVTVFLAYFLVVTNFLFSQEIGMVVYMLLAVWAITGTLYELNLSPASTLRSTPGSRFGSRSGIRIRENLRVSGGMLLKAVPLMLVLFVLFPRVAGPLWGLPKDALAAKTGLSNEMSPGQISDLNLSNKIAFRVEFAGAVPAPGLLYFRGPVFESFDGVTWRAPKGFMISKMSPRLAPKGEPVDYAITLEPQNSRVLPVLELPERVTFGEGLEAREYFFNQPDLQDPTAFVLADFKLLSKKNIDSRIRYHARSYTQYTTDALTDDSWRRNLRLPERVGPRTLALAGEWAARYQDPREIVDAALTMFNQQAFGYTLRPPLLGGNPVEQFLFDTRLGYCEHYSSAFTVLMRAAGIPARVVTGYQGGEYNALGNYLVVRQSDAHAWSEVWLEDLGWTRIDPTAAVAPERIERGASSLAEIAPGPFTLADDHIVAKAWLATRDAWDTLNNQWNLWVLSYGPELQKQFLSGLGFGEVDWREMTMALAALFSSLLGFYALRMARRARKPVDETLAAWRRFCAKLAAQGLAIGNTEGPLDYSRRVAATRPELAAAVARIAGLYMRQRYARPNPDQEATRKLRRWVREFRA